MNTLRPNLHETGLPFLLCALLLGCLTCAESSRAEEILEAAKDDSSVTIKRGGQTVLKYLYSQVPYKPYVAEFCTPAGVNVLRDSPEDHKHHHGLMFAITVDGVNFWEEAKAPGTEKHVGTLFPMAGKVFGAQLSEEIEWLGPTGGSPLLKEIRNLRVHPDTGLNATLLTWTSTFMLPPDKKSATLTGTNYHGLGMRFLESMDRVDEFFNADGKTGVEGTNDQRSAWCAFSAEADGKPVTLAVFDFGGNPRHPATWFTMKDGFSYLSATLNLSKEPYELKAGQTLRLLYGVALWDGKVENAEVEKAYRDWLSLAGRPLLAR
jgi:hypothetical protein